MADSFVPSLLKRDAIDDGLSNSRGQSNATLSIIFVVISTAFVSVRLIARGFLTKTVGADDYLIVGALILASCLTITYNKEAQNGFGLHTSQVNYAHKVEAFKWFFAAQIIYKIATCLTKLSVLALYLRIFVNRSFRTSVWTTMSIIVAYTLAATLTTVFSCNPIRKSWDKKIDGNCLNIQTVWTATSLMIILTDVMTIFLPIWEIRKLQLPRLEKTLLCGLFGLGAFVISCTIVRMCSLSPATTAQDQIYYQATSNSWTFLEVNVGIICACLPVCRVPFSRILFALGLKKATTTQRNTGATKDYELRTVGAASSRSNPAIKLDSFEEDFGDNGKKDWRSDLHE